MGRRHLAMYMPHGWLERLSVGQRAPLAAIVLASGAYAFSSLGVATKLSWGMSFPDGMTSLPLLVGKHLLLTLPFVLAGCGMAMMRKGSR